MNLRLPIVAAVVAAAAGAAVLRGGKPATVPAAFSTDGPTAVRTGRGRRYGSVAPPPRAIVVYVAGDVHHAGIYKLPPGSRAVDAVAAAGGPGAGADLVAVNLAAELTDGDEVAVPAIGDVTEPAGTVSAGAAPRRASHAGKRRKRGGKRKHRRRSSGALAGSYESGSAADAASIGDVTSDAGPSSVVDINSADESELQTLPGIGATLAERIVAFREQSGPFATVDDLLDVAGVSQAKLDAIAPYVSVGATSP